MIFRQSKWQATLSSLPDGFRTLLSPGQMQKDIEEALTIVREVHPNMFGYGTKRAFALALERLRTYCRQPKTRSEFFAELAPTINTIECGHTFAYCRDDFKYYREHGGLVFPLRVATIAGRLFVETNHSRSNVIQPGDELRTINGKPVPELMARLGDIAGGETVAMRNVEVTQRLPMFLFYVYGWGSSFTLELSQGQQSRVIEVEGIPYAELTPSATSNNQIFEKKRINGTSIAYLKFDSFPDKREAFDAGLLETFQWIRDQKATGLIVDLRRNGGGDTLTAHHFMDYWNRQPYGGGTFATDIKVANRVKKEYGKERYIEAFSEKAWLAPNGSTVTEVDRGYPGREPQNNALTFTGKTVFLIDPYTFSTAGQVAGWCKDYKLAPLVGEPIGGASMYGQCYITKLPESKVELWVATKKFYQPGKNIITHEGTRPDFPVSVSVEDLRNGRDRALEKAISLLPA